MADPDRSFTWIESSPTSLLAKLQPLVWFAGRTHDLLPLDNDEVLVASDSGGLWLAKPDGTATPLSNEWAYPDVRCIVARRPLGGNRMYLCGTEGALYMWNAPDPLDKWISLNLPEGVKTVYRIVTVDGGYLVIATDGGIWWAEYGGGKSVFWHVARRRNSDGRLTSLGGVWSGLAATGAARFAAGTFEGAPVDTILSPAGSVSAALPLLWGQFEYGELVFQAASIGVPTSDRADMGFISVASCMAQPARAYAATFRLSGTSRGAVLHLLRSDDGGQSWSTISATLGGKPHGADKDLRWLAGNVINGGWFKHVSVHPANPDRVAVTALNSFISEDGGGVWTPVGGDWTNLDANGFNRDWVFTTDHIHPDHHLIAFAPTVNAPDRCFIATDGGVTRAEDWRNPDTFTSLHSKGLRTLQFYSPIVARNYLGSVGASQWTRGLVAGGLQDNGNAWKPDHASATWRQSEGGDGGFNVPLAKDRYAHQKLEDSPLQDGGAVRIRQWTGTGDLDAAVTVALRDGSGNTIAPLLKAAFEPVRYPLYSDANGKLLHAIGWRNAALYGLFGDDDAGNPFWMLLGTLAIATDTIVTVASYDGSEILLATGTGTVFAFDTATATMQAMTTVGLPTVTENGKTIKPTAGRIVPTALSEGIVVFHHAKLDRLWIARRSGNLWVQIPSPPADPFGLALAYGVDADDTDPRYPPLLMVATISRVWATRDWGAKWTEQSKGLPRQPQCTDLRFNRFKRRWHLGTWGRSMWQTGRRVQVGVSSLTQSDFIKNEVHHNFEALVLLGDELFHYFKDNRDVRNRWVRGFRLSSKATAPACIIRGDYEADAQHKNFEALVLEGRVLTHWYRDNSTPGRTWHSAGAVVTNATGPASMIQSDYLDDGEHGNFEALIPTEAGLEHWYRSSASGTWKLVATVTTVPNSIGCIATSDYQNAEGHRAFEALVFEASQDGGPEGALSHFYFEPSAMVWKKTRTLTDNALGPASLLQSDYINGATHHNLEALVWHVGSQGRPVLQHFFRRDDIGELDWVASDIVSDNPDGPASMIRSDFRENGHDNFEAIFVEIDNEVWHRHRDQSVIKWSTADSVT